MRHSFEPRTFLIQVGLLVFLFGSLVQAQDGSLENQIARAEQNLRNAEIRLNADPNSKPFRRDLADEIHRLAHLEESRSNFIRAIELHNQCLNLYILSGERTRSSWDDGLQHTFEHLFMAHFDQAKLEHAAGRHLQAHRWYFAAFHLFVRYRRIFTETTQLGRVRMRVQSFDEHAPMGLKKAIYKLLGEASPIPLSAYNTFVHSKLQCIELF